MSKAHGGERQAGPRARANGLGARRLKGGGLLLAGRGRHRVPAGLHQPGGHQLRRVRADLRHRGDRVEHLLRQHRLHLARPGGVLRQRRLRDGHRGPGLAHQRHHGVRAAPALRGGRGAHRGPVRPDRAAGAAAHVHRDHHRRLLHLPADGVQLLLHRRVERPGLAVPQLAGGELQHALLLHRARLRGRLRSPSPGWSGAPGSACSCGRSGTTRTGRAASACGPCG